MTERPIPPEWLHPPDTAAARRAQIALAERVVQEDAFGEVRLLGGVDVSNNRFDPEQRIFAAVVALSFPELRVVETAGAVARASMPYIPGLLGFREIPALLAAWEKLGAKPDLVLVDGHGVAHPRRLGIAAHLGVVLDLPVVGVAKSILVGKPDPPLPEEAGTETPLLWRGERIGTALRTRRRANPLFVSIGHRVSLESAVSWVRRDDERLPPARADPAGAPRRERAPRGGSRRRALDPDAMHRLWLGSGAVAGAVAVALAAWLAHGAPARLDAARLGMAQNAATMLGWHALALLATGLVGGTAVRRAIAAPRRRPPSRWACCCSAAACSPRWRRCGSARSRRSAARC